MLCLESVPGRFALAKLAPHAVVPAWVDGPGFTSVTRTDRELSIVAPASRVPAELAATDEPLVALRVRGTLDLSLVGVLAALSRPLADAGVAIFVLSTVETDYLFVAESAAERTVAALRNAGLPVD
jgi:hypothetical protein